MLSRDILKRIGILGVTMGLAASPFVWSAGSDKEADAAGGHGGTSTMTDEASGTMGASGSAETDAEKKPQWEEKKDGGEPEGTGDRSDEVSSDPGAPGEEGGEGTQGGEEPDPNDTDSNPGIEEDET